MSRGRDLPWAARRTGEDRADVWREAVAAYTDHTAYEATNARDAAAAGEVPREIPVVRLRTGAGGTASR